MDRIMPIDLENAKLRTSFRGYLKEDVDEILLVAARTIEKLIADNAALREQNERQRVEINMLQQEETLIKQALIAAQRTADDVRTTAQKHADLILEEARQAALAERVAAQQGVSELRWELERLKQERRRFVDEYTALLDRTKREIEYAPDAALVQIASA